MAVSLQELGQHISQATAGAVVASNVRLGELMLETTPEKVVGLLTFLRDDPKCLFKQLVDVCGVDWPEREKRFDVVYNLLSLSHNHRVRVVITTDAATPVASVVGLWPSVTWFEREVWDMHGVVFSGQPDLRRILTDYGFDGHPLRKDFPLTGFVELRYDEELKRVAYGPVQLTQEYRDFDYMSPWEAMTSLPGDEKVHLNRLEGPA